MTDKQICSRLRSEFSVVGFVLLAYYGIMNVAVILVATLQVTAELLPLLLGNIDDILTEQGIESILDSVLSNGWGYLLATLIGAVILLLWKKKRFCLHDIWTAEQPMTISRFFMILCLFLSAQALVQLVTAALEWIFNLFGMSIMDSMESMTVSGDTLSMFLYMGLAAPFFEEILFRGFVLRTLEPYGKKFAILASAFLFGIFHGNLLQTPFAFAVGLILGYVTIEYSIGWAILLHLINNLILGDALTRISQLLPPWVGELIFAFVIWGSFLASVLIVLVKHRQIRQYFSGPKMHPLCLKSFFTSPGVLVLTGVMVFNIILTLLLIIISQL